MKAKRVSDQRIREGGFRRVAKLFESDPNQVECLYCRKIISSNALARYGHRKGCKPS